MKKEQLIELFIERSKLNWQAFRSTQLHYVAENDDLKGVLEG